MHWKGISTFRYSRVAFLAPSAATAATFGQVVAIGGAASDIALDESRGLLYIANFGAATIEKMSLTDLLDTKLLQRRSRARSTGYLAGFAISTGRPLRERSHSSARLQSHHAHSTLPMGRGMTFTTGDPPLGVAFLLHQSILYRTASVDRHHDRRFAFRSGFRTDGGH